MALLNSPVSEDGLLREKANEDEIRLLWDGILDILLERIHHKSISVVELVHLVDELNILLRAIKGRNGVWGSVIDLILILMRKDVTIRELRTELQYNESTIYRALTRLELAGFATRMDHDSLHQWTVNKVRCPVLYRASRSS
jgi:hypothetical protein